MLERMVEMTKVRNKCLWILEKHYDRVNRNKLFGVVTCYDVQDNLVDVIERIYNGSMVTFELESSVTGWCKRDY